MSMWASSKWELDFSLVFVDYLVAQEQHLDVKPHATKVSSPCGL